MKKKKILIVTYYFYPCDLIGAKRTSYLANFLADKGIDITILKADNENYYNRIDDNLCVNSDIRIHNVNNIIKLKSFKESVFWYFSYKKEMKRLIIKEDYDLIYFSGDPFFYFSLGNYFFKKYNIDYILDFRDIWVNGFKTKSNWKGNIVVAYAKAYGGFDEIASTHNNRVLQIDSNVIHPGEILWLLNNGEPVSKIILHNTTQIHQHSTTGSERKMRHALGSLGTESPDIALLFECIKKLTSETKTTPKGSSSKKNYIY